MMMIASAVWPLARRVSGSWIAEILMLLMRNVSLKGDTAERHALLVLGRRKFGPDYAVSDSSMEIKREVGRVLSSSN
jgi:hypothetical protein